MSVIIIFAKKKKKRSVFRVYDKEGGERGEGRGLLEYFFVQLRTTKNQLYILLLCPISFLFACV